MGSGRDTFKDSSAVERYGTSTPEAVSFPMATAESVVKPNSHESVMAIAPDALLSIAAQGRNRRARTSAAMVGLAALSVGAADLSLFWNTKSALAADDATATEPLQRFAQDDAEPTNADSTLLGVQSVEPIAASFSVETDAAEATAPDADLLSSEGLLTHVVIAGETWDNIAERYSVSPQSLATANYLSLDSTLRAGQILRVPDLLSFAADEVQDFADVPLVGLPTAAESSSVSPVAFGPLPTEQTLLKGDLETLKADASPKNTAISSSVDSVNLGSESLVAVAPAQPRWELSDLVPYRVQPGDTLDKIARENAVSRTALVEVNNLQNPNLLVVNQLIGIPRTNPSGSSAPVLNFNGAPNQQTVVLESGQVNGSIFRADSFTAATPELETAALPPLGLPQPAPATVELPVVNVPGISTPAVSSLEPSLPVVGFPGTNLPNPSSPTVVASVSPGDAGLATRNPDLRSPNLGGSYSVQLGDTLSSIARRNGISPQALAQHNGISNPNLIFVSQRLSIPVVATAPGVVASAPSQGNALGSAPVATVASAAVASTTVAAASLGLDGGYGVPSGVMPDRPQPGLSPHIQGLLAEVHNLQSKYRSGSATTTAPTSVAVSPAAPVAATTLGVSPAPLAVGSAPVVAAPVAPVAVAAPAVTAPAEVALLSVNERVNPEFRTTPAPLNPGVNPGVSVFDPVESVVPNPGATIASPQEQLLAAAPLGSESYEPLVQSLLGQQVSPQLPPMSSDPFLPNGVSQGYIWPAQGTLTSGFGWRWGRMHKGIDIAAPVGTPIVAAASGVVTYAGWNSGGYGNLVEIRHPDGSVSLYAHNNRVLVREGQRVQQGQQVAEMGSTGYSTGPHLHFEIHPSGQGAVNPMAYMPR